MSKKELIKYIQLRIIKNGPTFTFMINEKNINKSNIIDLLLENVKSECVSAFKNAFNLLSNNSIYAMLKGYLEKCCDMSFQEDLERYRIIEYIYED